MAHNETTNSGKLPYHIIIIVRAPITSKVDKIVFHNISLVSSLSKKHEFHPIEVDKNAEPIEQLSFPVTKKNNKSYKEYQDFFSSETHKHPLNLLKLIQL